MGRTAKFITAALSLLSLGLIVTVAGGLAWRAHRDRVEEQRRQNLVELQDTMVNLRNVLDGATSVDKQHQIEREMGRWPITGPGFLVAPDFTAITKGLVIHLKVERVFKGTPADDVGMKPGDLLIDINGNTMLIFVDPAVMSPSDAGKAAVGLVVRAGALMEEHPTVTVTTDKVIRLSLRKVLFGSEIAHVLDGSGSAWVKEIAVARTRLAELKPELESSDLKPDDLAHKLLEMARIYKGLRIYQDALSDAIDSSTVPEPPSRPIPQLQ